MVTEDRTSQEHHDASGFRYFHSGRLGEAHALAHQLLDAGRLWEGYQRVGALLEKAPVEGDEHSIHVQWHLAVFEIGVGRVRDARARFEQVILPFVPEGKALSDGPSLLWRLSLAGESPPDRHWEAVREAALGTRPGDRSCWVVLHNLLAYAGARDRPSIDRWLDNGYARLNEKNVLLLRIAWALRLYSGGLYSPSARLIEPVLREIPSLGGSVAQAELFADLRASAWRAHASQSGG